MLRLSRDEESQGCLVGTWSETETKALLQVKIFNDASCFVSSSIIEKGEESCTDLIEAHKDCMRALGFKI